MTELLDTNYEKWNNYYQNCGLVCNDNKYCPYKIGNCCLGDVLYKDKNNKTTLRDILKEVLKNETKIK